MQVRRDEIKSRRRAKERGGEASEQRDVEIKMGSLDEIQGSKKGS